MRTFYLLAVMTLAMMLLTTTETELHKPNRVDSRRTFYPLPPIPVWRGEKNGREMGSDALQHQWLHHEGQA